ncbi:MAG: adenylate kinase [Clostridia bacterium]
MRLVLLGPPGAGKGTQADILAAHYGVPHVSTGDLFRYNLRQGTALGLEAKGYMDVGILVPDDVTSRMVADRIDRNDAAPGFVLDGYPRNVTQGESLQCMLAEREQSLDRAVVVDVPEELLLRRLTGRRLCPACQATYHVEFSPPVREGICDRCGAELVQRPDDREETVAIRLQVYRDETAPLVDFYRTRGLLASVSGDGSVEDVTRRIREVLDD